MSLLKFNIFFCNENENKNKYQRWHLQAGTYNAKMKLLSCVNWCSLILHVLHRTSWIKYCPKHMYKEGLKKITLFSLNFSVVNNF